MTHGAWAAALDELEHHLRVAEELAAGHGVDAAPAAAWEPPHLTEPMPRALLPRARELQLRQLAAQAALSEALAVVRSRQQRARRSAGGTGGATAPATAAYVDVSA